MTNLETILDKLATALEAITPEYKPGVKFKRWRGEKRVEDLPQPNRERAFQFRMGRTLTPRTLSSPTLHWHRNIIVCAVGYVFEESRQGDAQGLGPHRICFADEKMIIHKLYFANSLAGVSNVLKLMYPTADEPGATSRTFRFDLEWGETFTS